MFRFADQLMPKINENAGRIRAHFPEIEDEKFWQAYERASKFSLLNVTGFYNLWQSAHYIAKARLPGDLVECGCFLGGAAAFVSMVLSGLGVKKRFFLFDTFEGPPLDAEDTVFGVQHRGHKLPDFEESVRTNLRDCGVDLDLFTLVRGKVEDTLPTYPIDALSLLRLDTDFYESTKCEFKYLYPRLVRGGVLIVDDYGLFQGSRRATDEYFALHESPPLFNRIDIGIWAGVKP